MNTEKFVRDFLKAADKLDLVAAQCDLDNSEDDGFAHLEKMLENHIASCAGPTDEDTPSRSRAQITLNFTGTEAELKSFLDTVRPPQVDVRAIGQQVATRLGELAKRAGSKRKSK